MFLFFRINKIYSRRASARSTTNSLTEKQQYKGYRHTEKTPKMACGQPVPKTETNTARKTANRKTALQQNTEADAVLYKTDSKPNQNSQVPHTPASASKAQRRSLTQFWVPMPFIEQASWRIYPIQTPPPRQNLYILN